ncbi:MAG TPA: (2Fe-2S) ferredoxin domain-containing protein [Anaeromyxobacteraceae bacterium]|nr:(2Fe-2S) ferredoxin domain-containing protein [Anaeromyxobacteraceae bacterium]
MTVRWRVSVCKGVDCRSRGSDAVWAAAREVAARLGLPPERCWLYRGGCYGLCQLGPNVVVRSARPDDEDPLWRGHYRLLNEPEEHHYWRMDGAKLERVLREHVRDGRPAENLLCPPGERPDRR